MLGKDLLKILKESKYTTVLSGFEMLQENGYPAIRDGEESYDIEQKYGYSVDEMFTSAFYSTRKPQFFEFYRNELLSALDIPPGKGYGRAGGKRTFSDNYHKTCFWSAGESRM